MTEKTTTDQEPAATTAQNPMAEMCAAFASKWTSGCGPKGFEPPSCLSRAETPTKAECGEQAEEGEVSHANE